jgi:hypothetical protein
MALEVSATPRGDLVMQIVELKIEETKVVVGGAQAAMRQGGPPPLIREIVGAIEGILHPRQKRAA